MLTARFYLDYNSHPLPPFSLASQVFIRVYSEAQLKVLLAVLTTRVAKDRKGASADDAVSHDEHDDHHGDDNDNDHHHQGGVDKDHHHQGGVDKDHHHGIHPKYLRNEYL